MTTLHETQRDHEVRTVGIGPEARPAIMRVCAGEALVITNDDPSLLDLINDAEHLFDVLIDRDQDPDEIRLAEVIIERICDRHGIDMVADGVRVSGLNHQIGRYLIPEAVELAQRLPEHRRGVGKLTIHDLKRVPRMLAGGLPLPAATVAGDLLKPRRLAYTCLWLNLEDAATVTDGGARALETAMEGINGSVRLRSRPDARTGHTIVSPADLRNAGLLIEPTQPHGLAQSTASAVISTLQYSLERARTYGANLRGTFEFPSIPAVGGRRQREPVKKEAYVSLRTVHEVCGSLGIISQVCLWLLRLLGLRISESFGLNVRDFWRDPDTGIGMLNLDEQGGGPRAVRNGDTGKIEVRTSKKGLKAGGERIVPIVEPLAQLIEHVIDTFHTSPDGDVRLEARLLPGLTDVDEGRPEPVRRQLEAALKPLGIVFDPHTMRASAITDLERRNVSESIRFHYVGHKHPDRNIQRRHYIAAPTASDFMPAVDALTAECEAELESLDLRVPTSLRQRWNVDAVPGLTGELLDYRLISVGWLEAKGSIEDPMLTAVEAATVLRTTPTTVRRYMDKGLLPFELIAKGKTTVRHVHTSDVLKFKAELSLPTIQNLADELGLTYAQAWHLVSRVCSASAAVDGDARDKAGGDSRRTGRRVRLSTETIEAVRAEHARRQVVTDHAMPLQVAAAVLDLPIGVVDTLVRRGDLATTAGPTEARGRYVTKVSVDQYRATHLGGDRPRCAAACPDNELLRVSDAARLMRLNRQTLSKVVLAGQVVARSKPGSRHQYITASSIRIWAEARGMPDVVEAVNNLLQA